MQAKRKKVHILKVLGKSVLGFMAFLLGMILLVHLPFVQKYISKQLPQYLTELMGAKVELQNINFSVLGCVEAQGLKIWSPSDALILSLDSFDLTANFLTILSGDFHLQKVHINGVKGRLSQDENGILNIQFIMDALSGEQTPDTPSAVFQLQCDKLVLENFDFAFQVAKDEMQLTTNLKYAVGTNIHFDSDPLSILVDSIRMEGHQLHVRTKTDDKPIADVSKDEGANTLSLRFDPGMDIDINAFILEENSFSLHSDTIVQTKKFDPNHIDLKRVDLSVSKIALHRDMLSFEMLSLMTQLPGFTLAGGSATIQMKDQQLDISKLNLRAGQSSFTADAQFSISKEEKVNPVLTIASNGQLDLNDFTYFMSDSLEAMLHQWPATAYSLDVKSDGDGNEVLKVDLQTDHSHLAATGQLTNMLEPEQLSWNDFRLQTAIGSDLRRFFVNMIGEGNLPPDEIRLQMTSSGNQKNIAVDGTIETSWGDADIKGIFAPTITGMNLDMHLSGRNLTLADYLESPWLGPIDLNVSAKGSVGSIQNLEVDGLISNIEISQQQIHEIQVKGYMIQDSLVTKVEVKDSNFISQLYLNGDLSSPMSFSGQISLDRFKLGHLLAKDSSMTISGNFKADATLNLSSLDAQLQGNDLMIVNRLTNYLLDTLSAVTFLSGDTSYFNYVAEDAQFDVASNFDLRELGEVINTFSVPWEDSIKHGPLSAKSRAFSFLADIDKPGLLLLAGIAVDSFSSVQIKGNWNESSDNLSLAANTGKIAGYGISYDTLQASIETKGSKINATLTSDNLVYNEIKLGDLNFDFLTETDSSTSSLHLVHDSIQVLNLDTRVFISEEEVYVQPEKFMLYDHLYQMTFNTPFILRDSNVEVHDFVITRDGMELSIDGDLNEFNLGFVDLNLKYLDPVLFPNSTVIDSGLLNGHMTFVRGQHLTLDAKVGDLILMQTHPITIDVHAETKGDEVPFDLQLTNGGSSIQVEGTYEIDQEMLEASVILDIDSLEMFSVFYKDYLDEMHGAIKGEAKVQGTLEKPEFSGYMRFRDVDFTTINPKLSFRIKDDSLQFDHNGIVLSDFVIFDNLNNPLHVSGDVTSGASKPLAYDIQVKTDHYALINRPESTKDYLNGLLVLGTDIHLKGDQQDTYVTADILVKDTTNLILTLPDKGNELINTKGIIEFVAPGQLLDTSTLVQQESVYDSLIASLPDFNLTSKVRVEEHAGLRINIDQQSGDYFQVAGSASLDVAYDRTGNPMVNGSFQVTSGVYSLSFYDLVKKDFDLVKGSSISWNGAPEDGTLDIKAAYSIKSNSLGLVGQEVGDNEKSVYKKTLDYVVGINIKGTILKPDISFSLDLPAEDKITYPALANKLSRLQQPEFQSDLNKQVFGLLVLGSFLPETSGVDGGQSEIATTALYNSVNSLLAGQLNKFAGQYIKGVSIDVGLQSYSDYSTNGGKTQTSMDFHVSKSLMNERLVFEIGGDFDISADQSGANHGKSYRGDVAIIYDLTGNGDKKLKLFNNESYDIIYQEIRNTGISLIFVREFNKGELKERKNK